MTDREDASRPRSEGSARLDLYMRDPAIMAQAERLLSGRTRDIRLKGRLAEAFRDRSWRQTAKIIRSWMVWVVILDVLILTINMFLLPRSAALAMLAPGSLIAPTALAVALVWRRQRSDLILGSSLMIGMFIILLSVSLTGIAAGGEWHERYLNVMLFVAIAGITIFSVPLWQTLSIAVMALALYLLFMLQNPRVEQLSTLSAFLFFASGVGATVMARRTMSILAHKAFLLELRDRRRLAELEDANGQLEELSRTDPLTGVANRRWMTQLLDSLWSNVGERPGSVAMLMCDVDEFKRLNDRRGHAEGDRCLVEIARIISGRVRHADYVARYGGEEFLVVLPDATETRALEVAERIRKSVEAAAILNPGSRVSPIVTISIGVAVEPDDTTRMTCEQLQSQADMALYFAKRAGRNRVELYKPRLLGLGKRLAPNVA